MKKIYTLFGVAIVGTFFANAITVKHNSIFGVPDNSISAFFDTEKASADNAAASRGKVLGKLPYISTEALKKPAKASDEDFNIITEAPEGTFHPMCGTSTSYYLNYGYVTAEDWAGLAFDCVETAEGEFYLFNPVNSVQTNSYIKGSVSEQGITFNFPQPVMKQTNNGETYYFYIDILEPAVVEDPEQGTIKTFVPTEERSITFKKNDDGSYSMPAENMIGITCNGLWQGYGEAGLALTELNAQPVTVPEGITFDYSYVLADESTDMSAYRPLGIAFDNSDVYIDGLLIASLPNAIIKGSFDEDARTLTIKSGQFLGRFFSYYLFMMNGDGTVWYDDEWECYWEDLEVTDKDLVFNFDPETKEFKPATEDDHVAYLIANFGNTMTCPCEYNCVSRIYNQGEVTDFAPINPVIEELTFIGEEEPDYSYRTSFCIYGDNNNGQMLMDKNIYYNIYVNDELYPLTVDEFPLMAYYTDAESITDIPASFGDDGDIISWGAFHIISFRNRDINKIGVQALYISGNTRAKSDIVSQTTGSMSVNSLNTDSDVVSEEYYDLFGRKVQTPSAGSIVVKRTVKSDGSVQTVKVVK